MLSCGGEEGVSATAQGGSAGSAKVVGNSLMLILNKNLLIIPPGQIPPAALLWGWWCPSSPVAVRYGGAHPAPALPHSPQQHPRCHRAAADPAAGTPAQHCRSPSSERALPLVHHFPGFSPHPVPRVCQEGKWPRAASPDSTEGDFKRRTNSGKAQRSQERNHQLYLLLGARKRCAHG